LKQGDINAPILNESEGSPPMQTLFARSKAWKIIKYKVLNTLNHVTIFMPQNNKYLTFAISSNNKRIPTQFALATPQ